MITAPSTVLPGGPPMPSVSISSNASPAPESYDTFTGIQSVDKKQGESGTSESLILSLASDLNGKWQAAKQHRETSGVDAQMLRSTYACDRQYEPTKLQEIRNYEKNARYIPPFHPIIDVKCRALQAKMSGKVLAPGDRPWSIAPTPIPDLPEEIKTNVRQIAADQVVQSSIDSGVLPDYAGTEQFMSDSEKDVLEMMTKKAKEANEDATQRLDDQLREGGWYEAVKQCLYDFPRKPACILKGPILKKRNKLGRKFNEATQKWETTVVEERIDTWSRTAPERIYPEPHSKGINDGYLFELSSYTRRDLYNAIGIPGYNEKAIRRVLGQWETSGLHEWTMLDSEKASLEKKSQTDYGTDIDCLIYWGTMSGKKLLEWGMNADVITDQDREYNVWAEMIGSEIIMARINPDPLGEKPYFKASLIDDPDRFWNSSVPDILETLAALCCAVLRACGINAMFSSGPIMDIAVDQLEDSNDTSLYPRRVIRRTTKMMNDLRIAVNFYQPKSMTGPLSNFLEFCHQLADEWTGIMRISHGGDTTAGGADSTLGGLSMNITESSVGIKFGLSNFDDGIIGPSVSKQYQVDLYENADGSWSSPYLDPKIVARGSSSSSMMAKEQQAVRRNEFSLGLSPEDKQILGPEGLKELLRERIQSLDMDVDKLLPAEKKMITDMTGMQFPDPAQAMPSMGAETLNAMGDKSGGRDFAMPMYPQRGTA